MDIRHKTSLQSNIKRFTLKATASIILTMNAKAAMASTACPIEIYGNTLAGIVCDFIVNSSVTVKNGGTVGGILMQSYQPLNSHITIDAGGKVSSTTGIALAISSSSLSNGLANNGTISSTSATAITISNSSIINGGISNSGLISGGQLGIKINLSTINGDIFNNGTINGTVGTGISILSSTINGSILNSGEIIGGNIDEGITLSTNSTITGDIVNSGSIRSDNGNGILARSSSTIAGNISNSGLISGGISGIDILNESRIQGNISNSGIINGVLQNGLAIHNDSSLGGSIFNRGTISGGNKGLAIFSATTVSGSISNNGTIKGGATGINISSTSTVSGGISNSGTIQGDIFAINISNSNVSNIDILGTKARIIGAVSAVNTDVNITNGAIFTSEGTYNVNRFNVATNAMFNMANTITVASGLNNSGILAVSNSLQTLIGDYTQNTGGIFQTGVSSAQSYGQLAVSGTTDLSNSGNIYVQLGQNSSLHVGDVLSNVISGNTFITPTSGFNVTGNSYIWKFTAMLNNASNGVNLIAAINPNAHRVCQGTYCQGAANTIINQVSVGNPVFSPYATLSTAGALQAAASQATPELTNENTQVIQLITSSVMDIVPMWGVLHGKSVGGTALAQLGNVWFKPYGATMIQDKNNTVQGFHATAYGAVIGKDIQLTDDWLLGGALAAGGDHLRGKSVLSGQSIESTTYQGMMYGAKKFPHHLYVVGQGLIGYGRNDTSRSIPLYSSTADGSYNSRFANIRAQLGWNVNTVHQDLVLTPVLDASYLFINQGSYQESGSLMNLMVASNNNAYLVLGVYGHAAYRMAALINQQDFILTGYAGIARNVLNTQPQTTATFVAGGPSFSTPGVQINSLAFRGGIGLTVENPTKPLKMNVNYDLQAGNNAYSGAGSLTITYRI